MTKRTVKIPIEEYIELTKNSELLKNSMWENSVYRFYHNPGYPMRSHTEFITTDKAIKEIAEAANQDKKKLDDCRDSNIKLIKEMERQKSSMVNQSLLAMAAGVLIGIVIGITI